MTLSQMTVTRSRKHEGRTRLIVRDRQTDRRGDSGMNSQIRKADVVDSERQTDRRGDSGTISQTRKANSVDSDSEMTTLTRSHNTSNTCS